jgi:hypothetical protein
LEPFKQYNFETIQEIHDNIILLLYGIDEFILNKENELQWHQKKQSIGLNINNFVNTFNYNILIVKEKGTLFISYIEFFHSLHTKHLQRFAMKMNLMYTQLTHDIRFDDNGESTDDKKKELINKYQDDNIDKELLKQIKLSVDDNASNFSHDSSEISYLNSPIHSVQSKSFDFESDNQADTTNNFNCFNSPKQIISSEEIDLNPVKKSMGSIFKKNVKKVVNSLGLFKNTKKTDDKLKLSSENLLNQTISSKMSINLNNTDIEDKISNKSRDSSFKKDSELLTVTNQESDKIEKTKSLDEIFLELSTQCNDLIKSNEKNSSLCSSSEETITSFIEIYDNANNGPVVSELVNNELDETELVNNELDETELVNNESDETESVNIEAEKTESVNIEAEKTELVNNEAEETELVNNEAEETELVVSELVNNEAEETKLINNAPFESEVSVETVVNKKKKKKSKPKKK